jgi:hypothetical protein
MTAWAGIDPSADVTGLSETDFKALIKAMTRQEQGSKFPVNETDINTAYNDVFGIADKNITPPAPQKSASGYTVDQLKAMVPASIADSVNQLSADQWNNIAALANKLPADKFTALQAQLNNIGWVSAGIINALSTDTLYNKIIERLQNA